MESVEEGDEAKDPLRGMAKGSQGRAELGLSTSSSRLKVSRAE